MRINLLPHREQKRQARQRQFVSLAIVLALFGAAIVALVHVVLAARIDDQISRNNLLKTRIAELDKQIAEIDKLRDQIQQVLARKQVVETLQANRNEAVHLLDQLVRQLPEGVYLQSVKQTDKKVQIVGFAQSNARVSTLMRNIEGSPWLEKPSLVEIKLVNVPAQGRMPAQQLNQFTLNFDIRRTTPETIAGTPVPAKTASAKGGKA
ncbi:MAG TPA: PilN domain-containing protein [Casimicrobiaceae bacterium]|nr:PilN domain-containing protein [Casimicrobiaceae bacterium]